MTLGDALYAALTANVPLAALVGKRIYPLQGPDALKSPYIIYQGIGSDPGCTHREAAGANERLVQFACFAPTPEAAGAVRAALIAALDGVVLGNGDNGSLEDDGRDLYDEAAKLYRADADLIF